MKPLYHTFVSVGLASAMYYSTHSWPSAVSCLLSGVLIDIDHHLDYLIIRKEIPWRYKDLHDFCDKPSLGKVYLFFHTYELLALFWFIIFYAHLDFVWVGLALGLTAHMICDQFTNPIKPLFYFISYRMIHAFEKEKLLTEKYFQRQESRV